MELMVSLPAEWVVQAAAALQALQAPEIKTDAVAAVRVEAQAVVAMVAPVAVQVVAMSVPAVAIQ
jgi:hypothetical protein